MERETWAYRELPRGNSLRVDAAGIGLVHPSRKRRTAAVGKAPRSSRYLIRRASPHRVPWPRQRSRARFRVRDRRRCGS